jgi:hypothetical protein
VDVSAIVNLTTQFLVRNNPIESTIQSIVSGVQYLIHFQSHKKIMKFRYKLYEKQMGDLEQSIVGNNPYELMGKKLYRKF